MTNVHELTSTTHDDPMVLYFGDWQTAGPEAGSCHMASRQHQACVFTFRGPAVRWFGSRGKNYGVAIVAIDGEIEQKVDCYAENDCYGTCLWEKTGLSLDRTHSLRIEVTKDRHPQACGCRQDIVRFESAEPVYYPDEIAARKREEYDRIRGNRKLASSPGTWRPVSYRACSPFEGVDIRSGVFRLLYDRNISYFLHCSELELYSEGKDWVYWLPASNDGRMLAIAANALRWENRKDLRDLVDTIVGRIEKNMRPDGYANYYPESESYALNIDIGSERKNYDRVTWTRGLLAAGAIGQPQAYAILRRMHDWLNGSGYLPYILESNNATNALPGGALLYLSPAGTGDDLVAAQKYCDQDYWISELINREPLCLTYYPGNRPHCYDLLGLEAFADEYRATGENRYLEAVTGGWELYKNNFKHTGGATAICEEEGPYPPKSYYILTGHNGETCGSVFWININRILLQLFPEREAYAGEIEESLYNVIMAAQDPRGYVRYHNRLQGVKDEATCQNTCCEVSLTELAARLPEMIYSVAADGVFVNLFSSSAITFRQDGQDVRLTCSTDFPFQPDVLMTIGLESATRLNVRIRVPSWVKANVLILVNGRPMTSGTPGSYVPVDRIWQDGDTIRFALPAEFTLVKYTGLEQIGDQDRYALMKGPVLMALQGELSGPEGVMHLALTPDELISRLVPSGGSTLEYEIAGYPQYRYVPYWMIGQESFTCFPIIGSQKSGTPEPIL